MRDPEGYVELDGDSVIRKLLLPLPDNHFLDSLTAQQLVRRGALTPFTFNTRARISSRKVPFVSYPFEWTHHQLHQAGQHTLDVFEAALAEGFELKDASAFNVIFTGLQPEFCDHLSFQKVREHYWWAYGQFLRHFILPLAASRWRGLPIAATFRTNLDGLDLPLAKQMLGIDRWLHRISFTLLTSSREPKSQPTAQLDKNDDALRLRRRLIKFLRWQLDGLKSSRPSKSIWRLYEQARPHYSNEQLSRKREAVTRWFEKTHPRAAIDLGCNQGEFSLLAAQSCSLVIAIDSDEASLDALQRRAATARHGVYTALASLDDPSPPRGWAGMEYASLTSRLDGKADVVLALAILHHLVVGSGIPVEQVAAMLGRLTNRFLIAELISPSDPMAQTIALKHNRDDLESILSFDRQRKALEAHFNLLECQEIVPGCRKLSLWEKRSHASH